MNPATACATVLVDELVRHGVREAVLCPGSRSAPLALALHAADAAGQLRLHVRTDERAAAFLALGLAKGSGRPVPVVTTSGTAVANLHPAVLEASHTGVPLMLLTADRPPELRDTGANQTTTQVGIFGSAVRWQHDLGTPDARPGQVATWRAVVSRAVHAATGARGAAPGPVHLNLPFREPLVPHAEPGSPAGGTAGGSVDHGGFVEPLDGRVDGAPWTAVPSYPAPSAHAAPPPLVDDGPYRTLVLVGDLPLAQHGVDWGTAAADLAASRGWPLIGEPSSGGARDRALPHGSLLIAGADWVEQHRPERVVVVGRVTLSRSTARLLRDPRTVVDLVSDDPTWPDPGHRVRRVLPLRALLDGPTSASTARRDDRSWAGAWRAASQRLSASMPLLVSESWPSGPAVAATVSSALPDTAVLFVGSSNPVRDLDLVRAGDVDGAPQGVTVVANRGLAGIDGCVSTAVGLALTVGRPTYALVGDLTFVHDAAALVIGPDEPRPDLTIVVVNDDGGGIFSLLEPGEPQHATAFDRVFGTPLGLDLQSLCAATRTPFQRVESAPELAEAVLAPPSGVRVVEVRVDRSAHRALHGRMHAAADHAFG